jgi:hypothetical protein
VGICMADKELVLGLEKQGDTSQGIAVVNIL